MAFKISVPREKLEDIARAEGCTVATKASYIKVTKGKSTNCLFVAKTKDVSRVDIGGFDYTDMNAVRNLGGEAHGCVHQQMKQDVELKDFLASFKAICAGLDTFVSHPKKERVRPHSFRKKKGEKQAEPTIQIVANESPDQTIDRLVKKLALAEKTSAAMGFPVSPKLVKDINDQIAKARQQVQA